MKKSIHRLVAAVLMAGIILLASSCTLGQPSYIEGRVTILPAAGEGASPSLVFSACQVIIYDTQTGQLSHVVGVDSNGNYSTKIRPGNYVVDLYRMGSVGRSLDVPAVVQINSGETLVLNITLDTRAG